MNIRKENLENIMQLLMGNFFFNHCTFWAMNGFSWKHLMQKQEQVVRYYLQ